MKKKILVTGGSGKIGTCVMKVLEKAGHEVVGLARAPPKEHDCRFIKGDLRNRRSIRVATKRMDAIVHLAALRLEKSTENEMSVELTGVAPYVPLAASN